MQEVIPKGGVAYKMCKGPVKSVIVIKWCLLTSVETSDQQDGKPRKTLVGSEKRNVKKFQTRVTLQTRGKVSTPPKTPNQTKMASKESVKVDQQWSVAMMA